MTAENDKQQEDPNKRTVYGHTFTRTGNPSDRFFTQYASNGMPLPDRWLSKEGDGNPVVIIEPNFLFSNWTVYVPHFEKFYPLEGDDAKERAFSIAVGFIEQKLK